MIFKMDLNYLYLSLIPSCSVIVCVVVKLLVLVPKFPPRDLSSQYFLCADRKVCHELSKETGT